MVNKRNLGSSDLLVSPIALGGNVFGWTIGESESFKILDAFVDSGFNFIDTADSYSKWAPGNHGGESETIIAKWLRKSGKRKDVIIATKFGVDLGDGKKGLSAAYMKKAVEASLKRLGTDYIDLYQSHIDDPETPVEETMSSFDELIKEGKIRYIGASNFSAERLKLSNDFALRNSMSPYVSLQPLYNLYDRQEFETEYSKLLKEENIAKEQNVALSQIAIAWLLNKPLVTAPIVSATSVVQLAEIIKSTEVYLSADQMERLDKASE